MEGNLSFCRQKIRQLAKYHLNKIYPPKEIFSTDELWGVMNQGRIRNVLAVYINCNATSKLL